MSKLIDLSAERKDEAYTDLAFVHEVWGTTFREHAIRMFIAKWRDERGEEPHRLNVALPCSLTLDGPSRGAAVRRARSPRPLAPYSQPRG